MSELTPCNRCEIEWLKSRYPKGEVKLDPSTGMLGFWTGEEFVAWFMEVSDECCC